MENNIVEGLFKEFQKAVDVSEERDVEGLRILYYASFAQFFKFTDQLIKNRDTESVKKFQQAEKEVKDYIEKRLIDLLTHKGE